MGTFDRSHAPTLPRSIAATFLLLLTAAPAPGRAQGLLDQFSYDGLKLTSVGFELGAIATDRLAAEATGALRFDFGYFAPKVRLLATASYFKGYFGDEEIARFETRLGDLVTDPTGDATIDVGSISLADITLGADLHYLPWPTSRVRPYAGVGLGVHFRDGDGAAIARTFVEDALDTIAAGVVGSLGFEIVLSRALLFSADARGELTSELRTIGARGGFSLLVAGL